MPDHFKEITFHFNSCTCPTQAGSWLKNKNMNWGWKIAIVYTSFALMVLAMVFISARKKVSLVEENYYQKEIEYQAQIDRIKNAHFAGDDFSLTFDSLTQLIQVAYQGRDEAIGQIHLYRPSDDSKDQVIPMNLRQGDSRQIDTQPLQKGLWVVKVEWEAGDDLYYNSLQIDLK